MVKKDSPSKTKKAPSSLTKKPKVGKKKKLSNQEKKQKKWKKKQKKKVATKVHAEDAKLDENQSKDPKEYPIPKEVLAILAREGITELFPIQYQTFNLLYEGMDIVGKAYTGSGKTLAFVLPVVAQLLNKNVKAGYNEGVSAICLTPTRELCMQVAKVFETYAVGLSVISIYGGSSYERQIRALDKGSDIAVGTCGRVKDMIEKGILKLNRCQFVILDEADEMLSMGFEEEVELILGNLNKSEVTVQTLLFSATVPAWINTLIDKYLREERRLVDLVSKGQQQVVQTVQHMAITCDWMEREQVLADILLTQVNSEDKVMIFCETKKDCNNLVVSEWIKQECQSLHGDIVQKQREITTEGFRKGRFPILICTDVAARGLDIKDVQLIIQLEPPSDAETYVHRSGRAGRAGNTGKAIMFYKPRQLWMTRNLEKKLGFQFKRIGAPQSGELARACAEQSVDKIKNLPQKITDIFLPMATKLLEEMDPKKAVANAFALISGYTEESKPRSVLSCARGMVAIQAVTDQEIRSHGYVFGQLEKLVDWQLRNEVKGMNLTADKLGAVFDCPMHRVEQVLAVQQPYIRFERITELPELESKDANMGFGRGRGRLSGNRRGGRGHFSGGRSYGGFRGGRSRGRGYRGGRGSRGGGYRGGSSWRSRGRGRGNGGWGGGYRSRGRGYRPGKY